MASISTSKEKSPYHPKYEISNNYGKYKAVLFPEHKIIAVGVPVNEDIEDAELSVLSSVLCYNISGYWDKYFALPAEKRNIIDRLMQYIIEAGRSSIHMGKNWEAILSFFHSRYQAHLSILAKDIFGQVSARNALDSLEKMKSTVTLRHDSLITAKLFCAYNFVSPDFIENGEGTLYEFDGSFSDSERCRLNKQYTIKIIKEKLLDSGDFDIEKFLDDVLDLHGKYKKWEIQSYYKHIVIKKESADLMQQLLTILSQP